MPSDSERTRGAPPEVCEAMTESRDDPAEVLASLFLQRVIGSVRIRSRPKGGGASERTFGLDPWRSVPSSQRPEEQRRASFPFPERVQSNLPRFAPTVLA